MNRADLPTTGIVFWPVGTGDSTTILVNDDVTIQVDINHRAAAEDDDDPRARIVDELVALAPRRAGRPYLSAFVLTHADDDHCKGFSDLLQRVTIGELWFTPRTLSDVDTDEELSDDAGVFRDEARRRVATVQRNPSTVASGDRIRLIGWHELLDEEYAGLPPSVITAPGQMVPTVDGQDVSASFSALIHTPFKDDIAGPRNRASVGMQVTLAAGSILRTLLLGDLDYPPVQRLLATTADPDRKSWDILLAPHHCSKTVMYVAREDGTDERQPDVLEMLEAAKGTEGWIIASASPIPATDQPGDNPPHAKAKNRYSEIAEHFLCTGEHPNEQAPEPIIFEVGPDGPMRRGTPGTGPSEAGRALTAARGGEEPAGKTVGFG